MKPSIMRFSKTEPGHEHRTSTEMMPLDEFQFPEQSAHISERRYVSIAEIQATG